MSIVQEYIDILGKIKGGDEDEQIRFGVLSMIFVNKLDNIPIPNGVLNKSMKGKELKKWVKEVEKIVGPVIKNNKSLSN